MRTAAKALELFLAMIVDEASKVTLERGWSGFRLKKESFATPVRSLTRVKYTHPIFCLLNDLRLLLVTPSSCHKIGLMKDRKESREQ